jgi:hypothetical protein
VTTTASVAAPFVGHDADARQALHGAHERYPQSGAVPSTRSCEVWRSSHKRKAEVRNRTGGPVARYRLTSSARAAARRGLGGSGSRHVETSGGARMAPATRAASAGAAFCLMVLMSQQPALSTVGDVTSMPAPSAASPASPSGQQHESRQRRKCPGHEEEREQPGGGEALHVGAETHPASGNAAQPTGQAQPSDVHAPGRRLERRFLNRANAGGLMLADYS